MSIKAVDVTRQKTKGYKRISSALCNEVLPRGNPRAIQSAIIRSAERIEESYGPTELLSQFGPKQAGETSKTLVKNYISRHLSLGSYCILNSPGGAEFLYAAVFVQTNKKGIVCPVQRRIFISKVVRTFTARFVGIALLDAKTYLNIKATNRADFQTKLCTLLDQRISFLAMRRAC